jgi:hypothetical protein
LRMKTMRRRNNPYLLNLITISYSHFDDQSGYMWPNAVSEDLLDIAYECAGDILKDRGIFHLTRVINIAWWGKETSLNHFPRAEKYFFCAIDKPEEFIAQLGLKPDQYEIL